MSLLLTIDQQQAIKPIGGFNSANNVAKSKFTQIATEVQDFDISELIGEAFLQAIADNPASYQALLDGASFYNCKGQLVTHKGLRYVIAYLNFATYINESYVNDTATGFVKKNNPNSDHLKEGERKNLQGRYRQIAFKAFELIREYLNIKNANYPLWCRSDSNNIHKTRFAGIKKTIGDNVQPRWIYLKDSLYNINTMIEDDYRAKDNVACFGTNNQFIAFTEEFLTNYVLDIEDFQGNGIELTSKDATGFYINSLNAGVFNYIAIKEK